MVINNINPFIVKQQFKNTKLNSTTCIKNILKYYALANIDEIKDGMSWYVRANEYVKELSQRFNISCSQATGIIAAFSPQTGWDLNKRYALSFLITPKNRLKSLVQYNKAKKILSLNDEAKIYHSLALSGKAYKTKAFFLNILNPELVTDVTIDRHAIAICIQDTDKVEALSDDYGKLTLSQYNFFQYCYVQAALKLDILPQQVQAITWLTYRRLRDLKQHSDLNQWQPFEGEAF